MYQRDDIFILVLSLIVLVVHLTHRSGAERVGSKFQLLILNILIMLRMSVNILEVGENCLATSSQPVAKWSPLFGDW